MINFPLNGKFEKLKEGEKRKCGEERLLLSFNFLFFFSKP
jgi:hypothetical protein